MSQCSPIVVTSAFPEIKNGNKFADRRDKIWHFAGRNFASGV